MISFLTCQGKMKIGLELNLSYQDNKGITHQVVNIDKDKVYKVTAADNMCGIRTFNGRIISFTLRLPEIWPEMPTTVDLNSSVDFKVDTITMDCSSHNQSTKEIINVGDIRSIEELSTSGLDEIVNPDIPTFR